MGQKRERTQDEIANTFEFVGVNQVSSKDTTDEKVDLTSSDERNLKIDSDRVRQLKIDQLTDLKIDLKKNRLGP